MKVEEIVLKIRAWETESHEAYMQAYKELFKEIKKMNLDVWYEAKEKRSDK